MCRDFKISWFIGESNGSRFLEHAGGGSGFATMMRLYPDQGLGIAILARVAAIAGYVTLTKSIFGAVSFLALGAGLTILLYQGLLQWRGKQVHPTTQEAQSTQRPRTSVNTL